MSFRINRVYTRSGDNGTTGLVGGDRVFKTDLRVCAYGDVDELNSVLGLVKERLAPATQSLFAVIEYIQQELFDLGSELATPPNAEYSGMWKADAEHIAYLEHLCDRYGDNLPELTSFILPGGSEVCATLHIARTVCRRAERSVMALLESAQGGRSEHQTNLFDLVYLNRLSDLLFILCRWSLDAEGKVAPLWTKSAQRTKPI